MNTYIITLSNGTQHKSYGSNPIEAFVRLFPNTKLAPVKSMYEKKNIISIELVGGQRASKKFYQLVQESSNELMIVYEGGYVYFKTTANTAKDAYREFSDTCERNGINIDNTEPYEAKLRNENYDDIDRIKFKR